MDVWWVKPFDSQMVKNQTRLKLFFDRFNMIVMTEECLRVGIHHTSK